MQMDNQIIICVAFDEGPVQGWEVSETLNVLMSHVFFDVVPRFEQFFPKV